MEQPRKPRAFTMRATRFSRLTEHSSSNGIWFSLSARLIVGEAPSQRIFRLCGGNGVNIPKLLLHTQPRIESLSFAICFRFRHWGFGFYAMCTVTFIARQRGYCLGMNRDEKLARPIGLPPER